MVEMRFTMAIVFISFTYLYLDCFQDDVLAVAICAFERNDDLQLCTGTHSPYVGIVSTADGCVYPYTGKASIPCLDLFPIDADAYSIDRYSGRL